MDTKTRADHAKHLLDDEVLQSAFDVVKEYHKATFTKATATDAEVLEARRLVLLLEQVQGQLRSFVSAGKILDKRDQHRADD